MKMQALQAHRSIQVEDEEQQQLPHEKPHQHHPPSFIQRYCYHQVHLPAWLVVATLVCLVMVVITIGSDTPTVTVNHQAIQFAPNPFTTEVGQAQLPVVPVFDTQPAAGVRRRLASVDSVCEPGFFCPQMPCTPGHYCPENSRDEIVCPLGEYCPTAQLSVSMNCTGGTFCPLLGTIHPTTCTAGHFCPDHTINPTICPIGYICGLGVASPQLCPPGQSCAEEGLASGSTCPENYFCPLGTSTPQICGAGKYCPAGSDTAHTCPAGSYCTGTNRIPITCDAGTICDAGASSPTPTPGGYYTPSSGMSTSTALTCPSKKFCPVGTINPLDCPPGSYCPAQTTTPVPCDAGHFCPASSDFQQVCPRGSFCLASATTPSTCQPGNICPSLGASNMTQCPPSFYCDHDGMLTGTPCPLNAYCPLGSVHYHTCDLGFTCNGGDSELPCPDGYYCRAIDSQSFICQPGTYCPSNSIEPRDCPPKSYCPYAGMNHTQPCPPGSFCAINTVTPNQCAAGSYCPPESDAPTPCDAGYYCDQGATNQSECQQGYICPLGVSHPLDCPPDHFCNVTGMASGYLCPTGSYCPIHTIHPFPCAVGDYCPAGVPDAAPCPLSYYCSTPATSPVLCRAGYFCPSGSSIEVLCPSGQYCSVDGTLNPTSCPAGYYCPEGSIQPRSCDLGSYCPNTGMAQPWDCPIGYYCSGFGNSTTIPTLCLKGTYCPLRSSSPMTCPPGATCLTDGLGTYTNCTPGYVCDSAILPPTPCAIGYYCPNPGMTSTTAIPCPVDTLCNAPGQTTYKACSVYYAETNSSITVQATGGTPVQNLDKYTARRAYDYSGNVPFVNPVTNVIDIANAQYWRTSTQTAYSPSSHDLLVAWGNGNGDDHIAKAVDASGNQYTGVGVRAADGVMGASSVLRGTWSSYGLPMRVPIIWELSFILAGGTIDTPMEMTAPGKTPAVIWQIKNPDGSYPPFALTIDTDTVGWPSAPRFLMTAANQVNQSMGSWNMGTVSIYPNVLNTVRIEAILDDRALVNGGMGRMKIIVNGNILPLGQTRATLPSQRTSVYYGPTTINTPGINGVTITQLYYAAHCMYLYNNHKPLNQYNVADGAPANGYQDRFIYYKRAQMFVRDFADPIARTDYLPCNH